MNDNWYVLGYCEKYGSNGYHVMQQGFRDSHYDNKYEADQRAAFLNFIEPLWKQRENFELFHEVYHDEKINLEILKMTNVFDDNLCPIVFWDGCLKEKTTRTLDEFVALLNYIKIKEMRNNDTKS